MLPPRASASLPRKHDEDRGRRNSPDEDVLFRAGARERELNGPSRSGAENHCTGLADLKSDTIIEFVGWNARPIDLGGLLESSIRRTR